MAIVDDVNSAADSDVVNTDNGQWVCWRAGCGNELLRYKNKQRGADKTLAGRKRKICECGSYK